MSKRGVFNGTLCRMVTSHFCPGVLSQSFTLSTLTGETFEALHTFSTHILFPRSMLLRLVARVFLLFFFIIFNLNKLHLHVTLMKLYQVNMHNNPEKLLCGWIKSTKVHEISLTSLQRKQKPSLFDLTLARHVRLNFKWLFFFLFTLLGVQIMTQKLKG